MSRSVTPNRTELQHQCPWYRNHQEHKHNAPVVSPAVMESARVVTVLVHGSRTVSENGQRTTAFSTNATFFRSYIFS